MPTQPQPDGPDAKPREPEGGPDSLPRTARAPRQYQIVVPGARAAPNPGHAAPAGRDDGDDAEDGFGAAPFRTAGGPPAAPEAPAAHPDELAAVAAERLTPRQLRLARRVAQKKGLSVRSDAEAVVVLRRMGVDPFGRQAILGLGADGDDTPPDPSTAPDAPTHGTTSPGPAQATPPVSGAAPQPAPGAVAGRGGVATAKSAPSTMPTPTAPSPSAPVRREGGRSLVRQPAAPPPTDPQSSSMAAEVFAMQRDLVRRRRWRSFLLLVRLILFVVLPTALAGYYYAVLATPIYASNTEMVIQMAEPASPSGGGGLFSGSMMGAVQDSVAVQGYLESREAMLRLDADHGFRAAFSDPAMDPIQRLAPDASLEEAYRVYQRQVRISFDPTEGLIRMEVRAPTAALAAGWSAALIGYAEEQVDSLSRRMREDRMAGAREIMAEAEAAMREAQRRVIALQERYNVLSGDAEAQLVTTRISALEQQLLDDRIGLEELRANPTPNRSRIAPIERRIAVLEVEIARLRARLTGAAADGPTPAGAQPEVATMSLARVQGELMVAQADMETRKMLLSQSMQQLEAARAEANRQVRYLSVSVAPLLADEAIYPRAIENTALAALILLGVYLMLALTSAVLREQIAR